MKKLYYAGIGSRETPHNILNEMTRLAILLYLHNFTLRSGGAIGADSAFAKGAMNQSEIFTIKDVEGYKALDIASEIHPAWNRCDLNARLLHARNIYQVMGKNIDSPVEFVICWTKDGASIGGTRTAIVYAEQNKIPVFNLGKIEGRADLKFFLLEKYNIDIDQK